jgi:microcystin-dependent protein
MQYASLYTAIGDNFGEGDKLTTFNIPDLRGVFLRGLDNPTGASAANHDPDTKTRKIGSQQSDDYKSHTHTSQIGGALWNYTGGTNNNFISTYAYGASNAQYTCSTGLQSCAAGGSETRPINIAVNYIIRY